MTGQIGKKRTVIAVADIATAQIIQMGGSTPAGLMGFMGWQRLAQALQSSGEVRPSETLTQIIITNEGLELRFK